MTQGGPRRCVFAVALAVLTLFPSTATAGPTPVSVSDAGSTGRVRARRRHRRGRRDLHRDHRKQRDTRSCRTHPLVHGPRVRRELPGARVRIPRRQRCPRADRITQGPGTITGFDNGVVVEGSNAHVKELTIAGPRATRSTARDQPATASSSWENRARICRPAVCAATSTASGCSGSTPWRGPRMCPQREHRARQHALGNPRRRVFGLHGHSQRRSLQRHDCLLEAFHAGGIALGNGVDGTTILGNTASNNVGWGSA